MGAWSKCPAESVIILSIWQKDKDYVGLWYADFGWY